MPSDQNFDAGDGFGRQPWAPFGPDGGLLPGPPIDLDKPFLAFVGARRMSDRFVERPLPTLLGERLDLPVLNLSLDADGPRDFDKPPYLEALNRAEAVVVEVMPARLRRDVLVRLAETMDPSDVADIIVGLRADYVRHFQALLEKLTPPRILFRFAPGDEREALARAGDILNIAREWERRTRPSFWSRFARRNAATMERPLASLIDRTTITDLAARCEDYVEYSYPETPARPALSGTTVSPPVDAHRQAAEGLAAPLRRATGRPWTCSEPGVRFVVVATLRTGTNLLLGLLRKHPNCVCGGELFNFVDMKKGRLGWPNLPESDLARLLEKRLADPAGLITEFYQRGFASGAQAVGFKMMYLQGLRQRPALDALAAEKAVKVIHVTRRNHLRRFVSDEQARAADRWAVESHADLPEMPALELSASALVESIVLTEQRQALYRQLFAEHDVLHVVYEDLSARPRQVAARVAAFLDLPPFAIPPDPPYRKTGSEELSDVVLNIDDLRDRFRRWPAYFDL